MQEIRVRYLGGEDPLEEEMATNSSILSWKIPWTEEPGGVAEYDTTQPLSMHTWLVLNSQDHDELINIKALKRVPGM